MSRFAVLVQQATTFANDTVGSANTRLLTQDLQGQLELSCTAFSSLAALVKRHDMNQMVLQSALRSGGKFVELFLKVRHLETISAAIKMSPCLACHNILYERIFLQLKKWFKQRGKAEDIKRILLPAQRGTRVVQTICAEAKAQRMGNVAKLVPGTKKNLEKFVQYARVLLEESSTGRFWVGQLKPKNLRGVPANLPMLGSAVLGDLLCC